MVRPDYIVVAFYTPGYEAKMHRLRDSALENSIPLDVTKVNDAHSSISVKGTPNGITKAEFILSQLDKHAEKTVVYVDSDMVFARGLDLDWSRNYLYQWNPGASCLLTSGCVQVYTNTLNTRLFLKAWNDMVHSHPNIEDDRMLDHTFNNKAARRLLRPFSTLPAQYISMPTNVLFEPKHMRSRQRVVHVDEFTSHDDRQYSSRETRFNNENLLQCDF